MLHVNHGKTRILKTIALTTAGLATAGLLAAASVVLPLGGPADESAEARTTLTTEGTAAGDAVAAATSRTPAPRTSAPTDAAPPIAAPTETAPVNRAATDPVAAGPAATGPQPVDPVPSNPVPSDRVPSDPVPAPAAVTEPEADAALTPRQSWLMQQQLVRECMAVEGHEYLYFEWWNPAYDRATPSDYSHPAQPDGLAPADAEAWAVALDGEKTDGPYRWQDAGCWGAIVEQLGRTS